ncbi:FK506-binding protein 2 [Hydra vulgaris]|uniref:peptidylprolyl isomerase n=1 Tax=Hydra vulgaris TaxID=6087 RepID=A0ABM4C3Q1_HYDVU
MFLQSMICLLITVEGSRYIVHPDGSKEFDGIGIGIVSRPTLCEKTTQNGDLLKVHFNGSLGDKTVFDDRYMKETLEFVLGEGQMIDGFEFGLLDMCKGEVRHLSVPPKHAYGSNGVGSLPSRVNLYFFVELLSFHSVANAPRRDNTFAIIDKDTNGYLSADEIQLHLKGTGVKETTGSNGLRQMMREILEEEDRDKNGYIGHNEFSGTKFYTEL